MGFFIFGKFIPYYGFCIVMGMFFSYLTCYLLCKKLKLDTDDLLIICAYIIAMSFIGAKLLYIIVSIKSINLKVVFSSLENFNQFLSSGFVFYGGLLGGLGALVIVNKAHHIDVKNYFKVLVPGLGIAHCFGRIGCSLAGCCYGKHTDGPLFFRYSKSIIAPLNENLFPVQGLEAAGILVITIICIILVLKQSKTKVLYLYLFSYSLLRFILEFFRGDKERGHLLFLSTSQVISVGIILSLIGLLIYERRSHSALTENISEVSSQE